MMRVFKHDGVVYYSSHRKIDASKSHWGNSPTFTQIYKDLKGPSDDQLFDPAQKDSSFCHLFLMVHPSILIATKDQVGCGYIVYIGTIKTNDLDPTPPPKPTTVELPETGVISEPILIESKAISLESANSRLRYGVYQPPEDENVDVRLLPGEFVIVYCYDENDEVTGLIRVQSIGYTWRASLRDNNPNLYHQYMCLMNDVHIPTNNCIGYQQFLNKYPLLSPYQPEQIKESLDTRGPFISWPQYTCDFALKTREEKMLNIWGAFMLAVPLHLQSEVCGYIDRFTAERNEVAEWLKELEEKDSQKTSTQKPPPSDSVSKPPRDPTEVPRIRQILDQVRKFAYERQQKGMNKSRDGKVMSIPLLIKDNIRNLVMKEEGTSLYRLIRERRQCLKETVNTPSGEPTPVPTIAPTTIPVEQTSAGLPCAAPTEQSTPTAVATSC